MASKVAILCLLLVSTLLSTQVHGGKVGTEKTSAARSTRQACGGASPLSITIGLPPIVTKLLGGGGGGGKPGGLLPGGGGGLLPKLGGGLPKLLLGPLLLPLLGLLPLALGPLLPLLGLLGPLFALAPLLGPLALLPLLPLLLGLLPLLLPLLLGALNPLNALKGRGWILRQLLFQLYFRFKHGWTKVGLYDGLSAGNRIPLMNQWGQHWGIYPLLGFPLSWRLHNQWGSPTNIFWQV